MWLGLEVQQTPFENSSGAMRSRNNLSMMKKTLALMFLGLGLLAAADLPSAEITNGQIQAKIYLPDAKDGYYRATRLSRLQPAVQRTQLLRTVVSENRSHGARFRIPRRGHRRQSVYRDDGSGR